MTTLSPPRPDGGTATDGDRRPARSDIQPEQGPRIRLATDAVVANYIRDISLRDRRGARSQDAAQDRQLAAA